MILRRSHPPVKKRHFFLLGELSILPNHKIRVKKLGSYYFNWICLTPKEMALGLYIGWNKLYDIYRFRAAPGRRSGPQLVRGCRRRQKKHVFWLHLWLKPDQNMAQMCNKPNVKPPKSIKHKKNAVKRWLQRFECRPLAGSSALWSRYLALVKFYFDA